MEKENMVKLLGELFPSADINAESNPVRVKVLPADLHSTAAMLKEHPELQFDYLFNMYGIDREDRFSLVYFLESTGFRHLVSLETDIADRENPEAPTLCDLWITSEFQEREVYDLLGVRFTNHPDLRRLFLEDGWGFPLRKDYKDEINIIER